MLFSSPESNSSPVSSGVARAFKWRDLVHEAKRSGVRIVALEFIKDGGRRSITLLYLELDRLVEERVLAVFQNDANDCGPASFVLESSGRDSFKIC